MDELLEGVRHFETTYIDTCVLQEQYGRTPSSCTFNSLRKHRIKLKISKFEFASEEEKYLGCVINSRGIRPDESKIRAINGLKISTNARQVRGFIGMISCYRRFIPTFSQWAEPSDAETSSISRGHLNATRPFIHWRNSCLLFKAIPTWTSLSSYIRTHRNIALARCW